MSIAMIRNMDSQGRIVIPAEIRKTMNLIEGDPLELTANKDSLMLRKYDYVDDQMIQHYLGILFKTIHCNVAVISKMEVIASKGIYIATGTKIAPELAEYIQSEQFGIVENNISATAFKKNYVDSVIPLGSEKCLILLRKRNRQLTDGERTAAQIIAALLTEE